MEFLLDSDCQCSFEVCIICSIDDFDSRLQYVTIKDYKITDLDSSYTVCHVCFLFQIIRCLVLILYDEVNYLLDMDGEQLANHDR